MPLRPVARRSVPDQVVDQLVDDVLSGDLVAGDVLPAERRLAELLGVSRPAVREALQRLAQIGLVGIRQGGTTTVRDVRRSAGPDLLPRLLAHGDGPDLDLVRSLLETRFTLAPDLARRCALRCDDRVVTALGRRVDDLAAGSAPERVRTLHRLWSTVVDGGGNLVERLVCNTLEAAYAAADEVLTTVLAVEAEDVDGYRALVAAIGEHDAARAGIVARRIVGNGTQAAFAGLATLAR